MRFPPELWVRLLLTSRSLLPWLTRSRVRVRVDARDFVVRARDARSQAEQIVWCEHVTRRLMTSPFSFNLVIPSVKLSLPACLRTSQCALGLRSNENGRAAPARALARMGGGPASSRSIFRTCEFGSACYLWVGSRTAWMRDTLVS